MRKAIIKALVAIEFFIKYDWKEYWIQYQIFALRANPFYNFLR